MQYIKSIMMTYARKSAPFAQKAVRIIAPIVIVLIVLSVLPSVVQAAIVALVPFCTFWLLWLYRSHYDPDHDDSPWPSFPALALVLAVNVPALFIIWRGLMVAIAEQPQLVGSYLAVVTVVAVYTVWLWTEDAAFWRYLFADRAEVQSTNEQFTAEVLADCEKRYQESQRIADEDRRAAEERTADYEDRHRED